jgi:hypothetical protein
MTLDELRDRICEYQISRDDVIAALGEPLAESEDSYFRLKLKQAMTSANAYYSSRKWGYFRTLEKAKARLIADIAKTAA